MKQLMTFDIENSQSDYSVVMEFISRLKNKETQYAGEIARDFLKDRFFHSIIETDTPKYLECYMGGRKESLSDGLNGVKSNELLARYFAFSLQENAHMASANDVHSLNELYFKDDDGVRKAYLPGYLKARFCPVSTSRTQIEKAVENGDMHFHIRVAVKPEEIYNLQYLALLLRSQQKLVSQKNISVVLLDTEVSTKCFPFCDPFDEAQKRKLNESHKSFSRFLRLLAKDGTGVIYAPQYCVNQKQIDNEPDLVPMNFTDTSSGDRFFPLIEITDIVYNTLFANSNSVDYSNDALKSIIQKTDLFHEDVATPIKTALFQTNRLRFKNADAKNPHDALLPYIAETAWKRLKKLWGNGGAFDDAAFATAREIIINRFADDNGEKNNWLTFALFSFLLNSTSIPQIDGAYQMAREMAFGLQQLMQNAIQHSEFHSCYFTFYLDHQNNLRLSIIDVNTKQNIIDNFKMRLTDEIKMCDKIVKENTQQQIFVDYYALVNEHKELIAADNIALRHFFNKFDVDTKSKNVKETPEWIIREKWKRFRSSDSTAHIGLLIFFQTIAKCGAKFTLQSSSNYTQKKDELFTEGNELELDVTSRIIPGTQYIISVSVLEHNEDNPIGEANISNIKGFTEGYSAFAQYVDYKPVQFMPTHITDIIAYIRTTRITDANSKFGQQLYWANFWSEQFNTKLQKENSVWYWRVDDDLLEYFQQVDNCEVFLKGLFASLNKSLKITCPIFFAMTNVSSHFLDSLRSVIVALSAKHFTQDVQLFFVDSEYKNYVQLFGATFLNATLNAIQLSIEHGSELFRPSDSVVAKRLSVISKNEHANLLQQISVMPFDVIVPEKEGAAKTIFDSRVLQMVENQLDGNSPHGYKLNNTHMRLGSKVHIKSFYEMSFLFYRTTISNRIAFKILQSYASLLRKNISTDTFGMKPLMFYSYASYSKAILTSLAEMSREYLRQSLIKMSNNEMSDTHIEYALSQIAVASYQHNFQNESNSNHIQLYFVVSKDFEGGTREGTQIKMKKPTSIVLIVPISSTFTTFDKMLSELRKRCTDGTYELLELENNYTAFWVSDCNGTMAQKKFGFLNPSEIEKDYWIETDTTQQIVYVKTDGDKGLWELSQKPKVHYFMQTKAEWESPLHCSLCFPDENALLCEVPLIETDPTSTIPSQQIRGRSLPESSHKLKKRHTESIDFHLGIFDKDSRKRLGGNNARLTWLCDCVYYGHIVRSKNHHQYYISTQDYFYKPEVQNELRIWLEQLRNNNEASQAPRLQIIFSPEHNTNVGFAQYVNTYYFDGSAEIISINEDKVFRSNFICEHEMLRQTIRRLHIQRDIFDVTSPVEFYFVDDSINTGETIHKANSLLRSLLPDDYLKSKDNPLYPSLLFKKCFFLIDRISTASKRPYVKSGNVADFHSFVHIDISNMRKHGDSCVGCKLQDEAKRLFKRSALRKSASYWAKKYKRLTPIKFDNDKAMQKCQIDAFEHDKRMSKQNMNKIFGCGIISLKEVDCNGKSIRTSEDTGKHRHPPTGKSAT